MSVRLRRWSIAAASAALLALAPLAHAQQCTAPIPNGDFERWNGDHPADWMSPNVATQDAGPLGDLRSVARGPGRDGGSSVHFRVPNIVEALQGLPEWSRIPPAMRRQIEEQYRAHGIPSSVTHCEGDCEQGISERDAHRFVFPVEGRPRALCASVRTRMQQGNKLWFNAVLLASRDPEGRAAGGIRPGETQNVIGRTLGEWTSIRIPLSYFGDAPPQGGMLQIAIMGPGFPDANPAALGPFAIAQEHMPSQGSEAWVDDLCFCDSPQLTVWDAEVFGGEEIPDGEKLLEGAQTAVNLDNDDEDDLWDYNPETEISDEVVLDDDELVRLRLRFPFAAPSADEDENVVRLRAEQGAQTVRFWMLDSKRAEFKPDRDRLSIPDDFEAVDEDGDGRPDWWEREMWLEGIEAHTTQGEVRVRLWRDAEPDVYDEVAVTVLGVEGFTWRADGGGDLDANPGHRVWVGRGFASGAYTPLPGESARVFPGRQMVGGSVGPRALDVVEAEVALTVAPVRPVDVFLRPFDIDDPTANATRSASGDDDQNPGWVDVEDEPEDNRGDVDGERAGKLFRSDETGVLQQRFEEQTATVRFQVTHQPGDNFKLVAAFDRDHIEALANDDDDLDPGGDLVERATAMQRIVRRDLFEEHRRTPEEAEIRLASQYASPALAVWRRVHVEVDHMDAIEAPLLRAQITTVTHDSTANRSTVGVDINIMNSLEEEEHGYPFIKRAQSLVQSTVTGGSRRVGMVDVLREGEFFTQPGRTRYIIANNTARESGADTLQIVGLVPLDNVGTTAFFRDDDYRHGNADGFGHGQPLPRLLVTQNDGSVASVNERYEHAFVEIDFATIQQQGANGTDVVPFRVNTLSDENADLVSNYIFDTRGYANDPEFWTVYLLGAYQGTTAEDGDPGTEPYISGIIDAAPDSLGASIFLLGNHEFNGHRFVGATHDGKGQDDAVAHEIAHLFGARHEDHGLMNERFRGGPHFSWRTIARIRNKKHP